MAVISLFRGVGGYSKLVGAAVSKAVCSMHVCMCVGSCAFSRLVFPLNARFVVFFTVKEEMCIGRKC